MKVGLCQQKLGALERDFAASATQAFSGPLKKFMESDLKVWLKSLKCLYVCAVSLFLQSILRERKLLESKRLDLDAAKNRLRKAKNQTSLQMVNYLFS